MLPETKRWHFGVLSFTGTGHLNPMLALCQELKVRGHGVTFFEKPKIEQRVRDCGFEFVAVAGDRTAKKWAAGTAPAGPVFWSDLSTLRFNLRRVIHDLDMFLEETPPLLRGTGVNALIVNEIALTGPTVAELLQLPYVIVSTSVPHHLGWGFHPRRPGYRWSSSWVSHLECAWLELSVLRMRGPIRHALNTRRGKLGLSPLKRAQVAYPPAAQIAQLPECLDFPLRQRRESFHYTGPWVKESARTEIDFPWTRLDGRPLVYASLGTTRNAQAAILRMIAEACQDLDVQLVISLGGRFAPEGFDKLPGGPIVVGYAPQLALLKLAKLVISHAGPNTAFESLNEGKPMVAIPLAHDQPAIAARLAQLHVAEVLPVMRLSAMRIRRAVAKILVDASYETAARRLQESLQSIYGTQLAADVIEGALQRNVERSATPIPVPSY